MTTRDDLEPGVVQTQKGMGFPGARTGERRLAEIIRVDHAGEYGATRIYAGQLAVLGQSRATARSAEMIRHMAEQEDAHLDGFNKALNEYKVRPTAMMPVWHVAGYALGAATALLGEKAAMACTEAVESVIVEHYAAQEAELGDKEPELKQMIAQFREEEGEHHDTAVDEGAREATAHPFLSAAIKAGCRLAIKISEKV